MRVKRGPRYWCSVRVEEVQCRSESDQCGEKECGGSKMSLWVPGFTVKPCGGVVSLIPQQNKCEGPL